MTVSRNTEFCEIRNLFVKISKIGSPLFFGVFVERNSTGNPSVLSLSLSIYLSIYVSFYLPISFSFTLESGSKVRDADYGPAGGGGGGGKKSCL